MTKQKNPEKKSKSSLPHFPEEMEKPVPEIRPEDSKTQIGGLGNGIEADSAELEEICSDLIALPFEIWAILKPQVKPLSDLEKKLIGKPLTRIVIKYNVARFMKDEILFCGFLGFSILKRMKVQKNVVDDSRKEGQGQNDLGEKPDLTTAGK